MTSVPTITAANLWLADPAQAHGQWRGLLTVAERSYADQSQRLYASLFGRFCAWMRVQGAAAGGPLTLANINAQQLGAFLDGLVGRGDKPASARTRRTYLAEIDRLMTHLQSCGLRIDNPALSLLDAARLSAPLKPRSIHLPAVDMPARFHESLRRLEGSGQALDAQDIQSICMALLMLECGLTHKELQKLLLSHVQGLSEGGREIVAPGHRTIELRRIEVDDVTARWLLRWIRLRTGLRMVAKAAYAELRNTLTANAHQWNDQAEKSRKAGRPRQVLFVSFAGKAAEEGGAVGGLRALGLAIDKLSDGAVYEAAEAAVFALSEATPEERVLIRHNGPQALRNLCCARMLARGDETSAIAASLGLRRNDQVWAMAILPRQKFPMSSIERECPGRSTTTAPTPSPHFGFG